MPWVSLQFVIVVFPDHTHLLFSVQILLITRTTMVEDNIEQRGGFVIVGFPGHTHLLLEISNKFTGGIMQESPSQFVNRIMPRVYIRSISCITRRTMYQKAPLLGVWKISSVPCGFSSIKIDYSDHLKSFISRINDAYVKTRT